MKDELKDLLNKAKNEVNNHPKGQLILPLRKKYIVLWVNTVRTVKDEF